MDDITFRHTAIATPNDKSDAFLSRLSESETAQHLVEESEAFDNALQASLCVDVPDDLVENILLAQNAVVEESHKVNHRWHLAIAASVAFFIGFYLSDVRGPDFSVPDIGSVALQHVAAEYEFIATVNEQATFHQVNAKLARYGGVAEAGLGEVLFVNYCGFAKSTALHMVLEGEKGLVTVFVVAEDTPLKPSAVFGDQNFTGLSSHVGKANLVIVGEQGEPLEKMKQKLDNNIKWDI